MKYNDEYYRLFTAGFVHFGFVHIAFNMIALISIGPQLESILGKVRFTALYFVSMAGASALSYLLLPVNSLGGGASGAIFGLMGGLFVVARRLNLDTRQISGWIIYSLVFSFLPGLNVDWRGHIGGLVTGAAVTYVHGPRAAEAPRARTRPARWWPVSRSPPRSWSFRSATFPALHRRELSPLGTTPVENYTGVTPVVHSRDTRAVSASGWTARSRR